MRRIEKSLKLQEYLEWCEQHHKTVGFVATMGALHEGHLSLVNKADEENDIVIVSIFVNPTQFNNDNDLDKYPRTIEADSELLEKTGCNVIFYPAVNEVYAPDFIPRKVDLGTLENALEGEHRPGHFDGVIQVVQRLFDLVRPTKAYFGRKDFQQAAVIKTMVKALDYDLTVRVIETVREESGLAMSSRNMLLSVKQKEKAVLISSTLTKMEEWAKTMTPKQCVEKGKLAFKDSSLELEYLEVIHPLTFEFIDEWVPGATACAVAFCGNVRLIDNMELIAEA